MNRLFLLLFGAVSLVAHAQVPDYVPTEGLVAWYPFNGNANDESGNGNDGVNNGATSTMDRFSNENSAYYFSGSGCSTRIDADVNTESINGQITISIWMSRSGSGCAGPRVFEAWPGSDSEGHLQIAWDNNYEYPQGFTHRVNGGTGPLGLSTAEFSAVANDQWTHIVYTNNGSLAFLYQDGDLKSVGTNQEGSTIAMASNVAIGRMNHPAYDALNGKVDDIGIWNRALTQDEILALYNAELSVPGCTDATACNFDDEANEDDGNCVYPPSESVDCEFGGNYCGEGTVWDSGLQTCVAFDDCPADLNGNGLVEVSDLLMVLADFGTECAPPVAEWTCGDPVNYHGYDYATVQIGEQCWFAENLRYMPFVSPVLLGSEDDGLPHAYVYGYDGYSVAEATQELHYGIYGSLYNYEAVEEWGLCPSGWSIPNILEWEQLTSNETVEDCVSEDWFGNDLTGLSLIPGGDRDGIEGMNSFNNLGSSSTMWIEDGGPSHGGVHNQNWYFYGATETSFGFSIRCVKDAE